jgi:hypothetical protein
VSECFLPFQFKKFIYPTGQQENGNGSGSTSLIPTLSDPTKEPRHNNYQVKARQRIFATVALLSISKNAKR